ncbi:MAG: hypothetical protein WAM11_05815 [Cyanobium sp.]
MTTLHLQTLAGCGLRIGRYPRFGYDASGGGGTATLGGPDRGGWQALSFEAAALAIPALSWRTTRCLGLPLPPGLRITIDPQRLEGRWQIATGALELQFDARFRFAVADWYRAPDLIVRTQLSTGAVRGLRHSAQGQPLDGNGQALLVGIATVEPTGANRFDRFLGLPDEALAQLRCRLRHASVQPA